MLKEGMEVEDVKKDEAEQILALLELIHNRSLAVFRGEKSQEKILQHVEALQKLMRSEFRANHGIAMRLSMKIGYNLYRNKLLSNPDMVAQMEPINPE